MSESSRAQVVSSFTIVKGAMIEESYKVFAEWDLGRTKQENLASLRERNYIGARSTTWLRDVAKVLNRRFEPATRDRALVVLAQHGCDLEIWKPIVLWHITRDEFLLRDFLVNWLFPAFEAGTFRVRPEDLYDYVEGVTSRGGITEHPWSRTTIERVATGLLKMAADFGLLEGGIHKEFRSYHLPEQSFLYLLHAIRAAEASPRRVIEAPDWRMFLMDPVNVEQELLRLHQFRKLRYEAAGSLIELALPYATPLEYAETML